MVYVSTDATMDNTKTENGESNVMPVMVSMKASRFVVKKIPVYRKPCENAPLYLEPY